MVRTERSILIIGVAIVALVVVAIVAALAFGSDKPTDFPAGSPERALQEYLAALDDGDVDLAYGYLSASAKRQTPVDRFADMVRWQRSGSDNTRLRIDQVERSASGDLATITLVIEHFSGSGIDFNRSSYTRPVRLVREDGVWKIDEPGGFVVEIVHPSAPGGPAEA